MSAREEQKKREREKKKEKGVAVTIARKENHFSTDGKNASPCQKVRDKHGRERLVGQKAFRKSSKAWCFCLSFLT